MAFLLAALVLGKVLPMAEQSSEQQPASAPQTQPKQPGLFSRAWGAAMALRASKGSKATNDQGLQITDELDGLERFKLSFARGWFILAALFLAGVAGWSVGYTFSGLHAFSFGDQEVLAAYLGSFALEGIFTGCLFVVTINRHRGRGWALLFGAAIGLALISVLAQFAGYEAMFQAGRLQVSDSAIDAIPILSWLVGSMQGHSILFLLRGCSFHLAEIIACLAMPSKHLTTEEQIAQQQRLQLARHMYEQAELAAKVQQALAQQVQTFILARLQGQGLLVEAKPEEASFRLPASNNGTH